MKWQTVIDFEVVGILAQVGMLRVLQSVIFVENLKVERALLGFRRIIGVERQLRINRRTDRHSDRCDNRQRHEE